MICACVRSGGRILSSYQAVRGAAEECGEQRLTKPRWIIALPEKDHMLGQRDEAEKQKWEDSRGRPMSSYGRARPWSCIRNGPEDLPKTASCGILGEGVGVNNEWSFDHVELISTHDLAFFLSRTLSAQDTRGGTASLGAATL